MVVQRKKENTPGLHQKKSCFETSKKPTIFCFIVFDRKRRKRKEIDAAEENAS
jgi:hypothetical protein